MFYTVFVLVSFKVCMTYYVMLLYTHIVHSLIFSF